MKKALLLSAILSSYLNSAVLYSVEYAKKILDSNTKIHQVYVDGLKNAQDRLIKYTQYYNSTNNPKLKEAYMKVIVAYQNQINTYTKNLQMYTDRKIQSQQDYDDTYAHFNPVVVDPTITPEVITVKPAIPEIGGIEYKNNNSLYANLGVRTAWEQGYTGKGITIANIDSGVSNRNPMGDKFIGVGKVIDFGYKYTEANGKVTNEREVLGYGNISNIVIKKVSGVDNTSYTTPPTVEIIGNGTGAKAQAILDTNGKIVAIFMNDFGIGYTGSVQVLIKDADGNVDNTYVATGYLAGIDYNGHGTATSSVMSASFDNKGIVGIAFDADVLSVKVGDGVFSTIDIADGARLAVERGATVVNQSLESYATLSTAHIDAYRDILKAGAVVVNASGNKGLSCATMAECNSFATIPLQIGSEEMSSVSGAYIVVGALDSSGKDIAYFSNRAGITKDYFILAPGTNVGVETMGGGSTYASGTSFSAPIVSGTMALLKQKWPRLSSAQQTQILFQTADDMGAVGVDEIYGWGKLNIDRAFSPIGDLRVPTISKTYTGVEASVALSPKTTSVSGSSLLTAKLASFEPLNRTISFDAYQRDYQVNMTSYVAVDKPTFSFNQFLYMPVNNSGLRVGVNNLYNMASVGYSSKEHTISYSHSNDVMGSSGDGLLGYSGQTHHINYSYTTIKHNTGINFDMTYSYASVNGTTDSMLNITDIQAVGASAKALYNGFGVIGYIPSKIVKGNLEAYLPTSVDSNGNVGYEMAKLDLTDGSFERTVGVVYEDNGRFHNFGIELSKTYDTYNIKTSDTTNLKIRGAWYF